MAIIRRTITKDAESKYELQDEYQNNFHRLHFDARLYHVLTLSSRVGADASMSSNNGTISTNLDAGAASEEFRFAQDGKGLFIYPYHTYGSFSGDYYETEDAIVERIAQVNVQLDAQKADSSNSDASTVKALENELEQLYERYGLVKDFNEKLAPHSLVHPYAIVKLAGAMGSKNTMEGTYLFDSFATRRWYEVDGDNISSYAETPTTTKIIAWGTEDKEGRTPYSYQDFVFCKNWNVIPNNRMITLRRYFGPVTDNLEFDNFKQIDSSENIPYEEAIDVLADVAKRGKENEIN